MPAFAYEILDSAGQSVSGHLDAADLRGAARQLQDQGARILRLQPSLAFDGSESGPASRLQAWVAARMPVTTTDCIQAFSHLSMMTRAGLSLTNSLRLIAPETPRPALRVILDDVATRIESGLPFSVALAAHPRVFPDIITSIIASAEESGEMADGLDRVCKHLEFWSELKRKLIQSATYPVIVILLAVAVTVMLVTIFIPKVESFVARRGRALPGPTQFLFDLAHTAQHGWPWFVGAALIAGVGLFFALRNLRFRLALERLLLRLPIVGATWQAALLARGCGLMAVLLQSGTSLVRALEISAGTLKSLHFRSIFINAQDGVVRGFTLRQSLRQPGIPGTLLGVIAAGEESGALPHSFRELENHYARRLTSRLLLLVTLIEPALILFVGGIVALVYMALFSAVLTLVR